MVQPLAATAVHNSSEGRAAGVQRFAKAEAGSLFSQLN
jgi:hypothetical protein